jgi:hypothetical protein
MFGELVMLNAKNESKIQTYLSTLDKLRPRISYRIAVLHVGKNQSTQHQIMHNIDTTTSFHAFLNGMGWKVDLVQHRANGYFMGGLDQKVHPHMLYHGSSVREVGFHVVPWMTLHRHDAQQIERKRHIGNDIVHIVWCDNPKGYDVSTFLSMVTEIFIVLIPLPGGKLVKVQIFSRDIELIFGPLQDGAVVSRAIVGLLARRTAVNAIDATKAKQDPNGDGGHETLHPAFFRRKRIQGILSRLSNPNVTQKNLASSLFA